MGRGTLTYNLFEHTQKNKNKKQQKIVNIIFECHTDGRVMITYSSLFNVCIFFPLTKVQTIYMYLCSFHVCKI